MLKHALTTGNGGAAQRGLEGGGGGRIGGGYSVGELPHNGNARVYGVSRGPQPPPHHHLGYPGSLNTSLPATLHHTRHYNPGNPYCNVSSLNASKHSTGGTSASVSPLGGPGLLPNGGPPRHPPPPVYLEVNSGKICGPYTNHQQHGLNVSTLSTSKHSLGGNSSSVSPPLGAAPRGQCPQPPPPPPLHTSVSKFLERTRQPGVREMLTSLGLLCLVSLLLALLSLIFMLKISPVTAADVKDLIRSDQVTVISPEEYVLVYEVTLALCALSLSLNLCCLLVCAVQFLFAVKLVRDSPDGERTNKYLKKSAFTRVCAVGGFFVSIPVFLTGIILYTFIQFHSTPAVVTSILIGLGIMFCGCAMVHNVFVWQKEKTNAVRALAQEQRLALQREQSLVEQSSRSTGIGPMTGIMPNNGGSISPCPIPNATLDLSNDTPTPPEICTLV